MLIIRIIDKYKTYKQMFGTMPGGIFCLLGLGFNSDKRFFKQPDYAYAFLAFS